MEMGEALFKGEWAGIINLTFSPIFAVFLGLGQFILGTTPESELLDLRFVNFLCFLMAMAGCDFMVKSLGKALGKSYKEQPSPLPWPWLSGLIYGFFLIASLAMIRIRLTNPDMLILFWTCLGMAVILRINHGSETSNNFVYLGVINALGYLSKAFFFMFGPVMAIVAALSSPSGKRGAMGFIIAMITMLLLSAPLIAGLSYKKGALTYGEGGRHIYAFDIAGKGDPIYEPEPVVKYPKTLIFAADHIGTRPVAFDVTYFTVGYKPLWRAGEHFSHALSNVYLIFEQNEWLIVILVGLVFMGIAGGFSLGSIRPLSPQLSLLLCGLGGIGLFCLIRVAPRYVAPFVLLLFAGALSGLKFPIDRPKPRKFISRASLILGLFMAAVIGESIYDQTHSSLYAKGGRGSYQFRYEELISVKEYLLKEGLDKGHKVAVINNPPLYWARMAGLRVLGDIDQEEFLEASPEQRSNAINELDKNGFKAIVAKDGAMGRLDDEGWRLVPETKAYYVKILIKRQ
jgi:hypothetical protein